MVSPTAPRRSEGPRHLGPECGDWLASDTPIRIDHDQSCCARRSRHAHKARVVFALSLIGNAHDLVEADLARIHAGFGDPGRGGQLILFEAEGVAALERALKARFGLRGRRNAAEQAAFLNRA